MKQERTIVRVIYASAVAALLWSYADHLWSVLVPRPGVVVTPMNVVRLSIGAVIFGAAFGIRGWLAAVGEKMPHVEPSSTSTNAARILSLGLLTSSIAMLLAIPVLVALAFLLAALQIDAAFLFAALADKLNPIIDLGRSGLLPGLVLFEIARIFSLERGVR
jgi:hypothetical protein